MKESQKIVVEKSFKELAESWSKLNIPLELPEHHYTEELARIGQEKASSDTYLELTAKSGTRKSRGEDK